MKKLFLLLFAFVGVSALFAQTFSGSGGTIPANNTFAATCFPITVSGIGPINTSSIGLAQVCLTITHPFVDELEITLQAPDGTIVPLSIQNGGSGDNYTNTCFTATAASSIKFGTPPFTGSFLPEGYLGAVNNGQNANGQWRLCVQDRRGPGNSGVLNSWNLTFSNAPAPAPPSIPTCATTLSPTSTCAAAPSICDFNGLCGSTTGGSSQTWTQLTAASCFGFQNNFFVQFVASAPTASFSVWVPTTSSTFPNGGVQMLFFSGTCGSGPVTTYGCYPHILPYSAGNPVINVVTAEGLTPGNTYYILIDGFGGDVSTFRLAATSGVNVFTVQPENSTVCAGGSVSLTASGGNNVYSWSPSAGLSATTGATVVATPAATTTYTVTSSSPLGCPINRTAVVTVNTPPQISTEPITNPQTVCQGDPFASVTLAAFTGSGSSNTVQWYSNTNPSNTGGTLIPGATLPTFQPSSTLLGTLYYYAVVTNNLGCRDTSAVVGPITVTPQIAGPVPSLGPFSTRCQGAGIVVYNSSGTTAPITYSLDPAALAAGNTIDPNTGAVTYVAGWVGQAVITSSVAGCNGPIIAAHVANTFANVVPVTSFSYSSPVCSTGPNPTPSFGAGFTPGGTFSAPAGLTINPTTGVIDLATSTLGTYTVTYTVPADPATCRSAASGTATITINAVITPVTSFLYVSPICLNGSNALPVLGPGFTAGGTWTSVPSTGISINPTTGEINVGSSTAGNYTITYTISGLACAIGGTASSSLLVNLVPGQTAVTNFSYNSPVCNGTASQLPQLAPGFTTGGTFTGSTAGLAINNTTGQINHGVSTPGTYTVTYSVPASGCRPAATGTATITINPVVTPIVGFTYPSPVCQNSGTINPTTVPGFTTGGAFLAPAGLSITGATGAINTNTSTPGTYTVSYSLPPSGCNPAGTGTFSVTITPVVPPQTTFSYPATICSNGSPVAPIGSITSGGTFTSSPAGLSLGPSNGVITPATSTPGTYTVTYAVPASGCNPAGSGTASVTVTPVVTPETNFSYSSPVCQSAGILLPSLAPGFTSGGVFSAPAGISLDAATGQINTLATTPGTYTVTYSLPANGCNPAGTSSASITVQSVTAPITGFSYPATICTADPSTLPTLVAGFTTGGTFTASPAGLSINPSTGAINPSLSTAGSYTIQYAFGATGCNPGGSSTATVTIASSTTPTVGFSYLSPVCLTTAFLGPTFASGFTAGGTFTAPAGLSINSTTGLLNLTASTAGTYTVTYTLAPVGCAAGGTSTASITLVAPTTPVTTFSYATPVCINGTNPSPTLGAGFTTGGSFTAPPGLAINASTGQINLAASTFGVYPVTYSVPAGTCSLAGSSSFTITIEPNTAPITSFSYTTPVCGNLATLSPALDPAFTTGGTFSSTAGLSINASSGVVNPSTSTPGNYTINYQIPATGCRPAGNGTTTLVIQPAITPVVGFSYATPVCVRAASPVVPTLSAGFTPGGQFTATPAGLTINPITGAVNLATSTAGSYTITYTLAAAGCQSAATQTANLVLVAATTPGTSFNYGAPVCAGSTSTLAPVAGAGFTPGGVFSSAALGTAVNSATGAVNLSGLAAGTYTVTYSLAGSATPTACIAPATGSANVVVLPNTPLVTGFSYPSPVCTNGAPTVAPQLAAGFTVGGTFSATGGLVINPTTGVISLTGQTPGNFTITYRVSSACATASSTATITIGDIPIPVVAPVGVCDSGTVVFQATGVGVFQWYADPALTQLVNTGPSFSVFINRDTIFYVASTLNGCRSVGFTGAQGLVVAPPLKPNLGNDTLICAGDALTLQSSTFNSTYQYLWSNGTTGPSITVTQPGTYVLTARINPPGCVSADTVTVGLYTLCDDIYFPNAFSPNNDGLNDRFGALGNLAPVSRYSMVIYNRWGQMVFTATNPAQRWDGTMNGKAQNPGNFIYRVEYQYRGRPRSRSGNLMLVR